MKRRPHAFLLATLLYAVAVVSASEQPATQPGRCEARRDEGDLRRGQHYRPWLSGRSAGPPGARLRGEERRAQRVTALKHAGTRSYPNAGAKRRSADRRHHAWDQRRQGGNVGQIQG